MESYSIFRDLAIIIIFAKVFGIIARKCKAPQVVGEIIAGLLIGPSVLGLVQQSDFLIQMAEIGVILLMFSAGLETNLKDLMKTGFVAFLIACFAVGSPVIPPVYTLTPSSAISFLLFLSISASIIYLSPSV